MEPVSNTESSFYGLGIAPAILETIGRLGYKIPTPIQQKAIPIGVEGKDILGVAQTGTGKTLAFGVPLVQRLLQGPGRALVLVPTRELALQVDETLRKLGQPFNIRTVILIGGMSPVTQIQLLRRPVTRVLIATPGRLIDHLEQKITNLNDIKTVVLDEADRMLDMGFAPQIYRISKFLPKERQTLFYSATMPDAILKLASQYMKLPIRVEVAPSGTAPQRITQELFIVRQDMKRTLLAKLLEEYRGSVLLFARTKMNARKITRSIRDLNYTTAEIHANRSLSQRREALEGFKTGRYRVLVATDIAARGIDVKGIELVINYDLPDDIENYIHRIGRTGRAGLAGHAISLATPDQAAQVRDIEKLTRESLKVSTHPHVPSERFSADRRPHRPFQPQNKRAQQYQKRGAPPSHGGHGRPNGPHSGANRHYRGR